MKIFVMHDDSGKIRGTFAATRNNVEAKPAKGMRVLVIEKDNLEGAELTRYLYDLHTGYRVETKSESTNLIKK